MENPIILYSLNDYINKKTAHVLLAVCKLMKYYIVPKCYRNTFLKLDTSDLAKIKMFTLYGFEQFNIFMRSLKIFKYVPTRFHCWTSIHWSLVVTYLIYRYQEFEYSESFIEDEQPYMVKYHYYINFELIICMYPSTENVDINYIYKNAKRYNHYRYRELIMI